MPAFLTRPTRLLPRGPLDLLVQVLVVFGVYQLYRLSRGAIDDPVSARDAIDNARTIVDIERSIGLGFERSVQDWAQGVWGVQDVASFLYINVQTTVTFGVMLWIYVRHNDSFGFFRNMFVATWFLALIGFLLVPTAPPRLVPGLGIHDSVAQFTGVDPSATKIQRYYNPYAAMPSLHCGVAALVGLSMARLTAFRAGRVLWTGYPLMVCFIVVATGNHYVLDAVAGLAVAAVGALIAAQLGRLRPGAWRFRGSVREPAT